MIKINVSEPDYYLPGEPPRGAGGGFKVRWTPV